MIFEWRSMPAANFNSRRYTAPSGREFGASPHTRGDWGGTPNERAGEKGDPEMTALFDEYSG